MVKNNSDAIGIYIHIPFCLHKCDYCDFYSLPLNEPDMLATYTRSLIAELQQRAEGIYPPVTTVYLGGGTPSLLSAKQVGKIIAAIYTNYQTCGDIEISMEANPATVKLQDLRELRAAGINRLSVGVQSFADAELKLLGRVHGGRQAMETLDAVRRAGFDNYNLDLIYGIPEQTLDAWQKNLNLSLKFEPQHISTYLLQLDECTPMAGRVREGLIKMLDDELEADMYYTSLDHMQKHGYDHYEISNFARSGYQCRHNLLYWQGREYLGIGSGAVSYLNRQRTLNQPDLSRYMEDIIADRPPSRDILECMDLRQLVADAIIVGLRLTAGISREDILHRFNCDILVEYRDIIEKLTIQGLLEIKNDRMYLAKRAYFLSNQVLKQFVA